MGDVRRIDEPLSGGCQCGLVRYQATARQDNSHVCHCRMCQKAVGNFFAALVGIPRDAISWTKEQPDVFQSSDLVTRGFCRNCGTPLFYDYEGSAHISVTTGSLDDPASVPPKAQFGSESRMPWFDELPNLPDAGTTDKTMPGVAERIAASNHQHPDHD